LKRITIKDISKIAGVSPKTVSRIINNEIYVKEETKKKVLEIIKNYNYVPNIAARSLVINRTNTLGLIVPNLENPFYSRLSRGVIQTAEQNNYSVIVCESKFDREIGEKYLRMLIERGVDGLLIATLDLDNIFINKLLSIKKPFVLLTCRLDMPGINYVIADDFKAGSEVVEYLIKLGHKNIAFLKGPDVYSSNERFIAYKAIMEKHGLRIKDYFITKAALDKKDAYKITLGLLKEHRDITAIIGNNDYAAIGIIKAVNELNLKIPEDISVIGYDDIDIAELLAVPLTTIHYPKYTCGVAATQRLISILKKDNIDKVKSKKIILETSFIERNSCGPPKKISN
jgi:DNA-binding LacI/PurR family transcriptional regulator